MSHTVMDPALEPMFPKVSLSSAPWWRLQQPYNHPQTPV